MITENIKKGTGLGHDAALRNDLAERKANYEKSGHKFNRDEVFGWEARTDEQFFGTFERLEQLLDHLDGLKAEEAVEPVEPETAAPADAKSLEDRAVEILVEKYYSEKEIANVAGLPVNDAKKALTKAATQDLRGSSGPDYHYSTSKGTIGFWFGNKMRPEADVEIKVARIASLVVEKHREAAPAGDDLPNVGDVPEIEKWAQDECRELEAKGWVFTPDENWNYTFSYEGITFGPHPTLERCVEGARSLDSLRAAGNVEELKQISFDLAVERLCVLQFKLDQADDALTTTTEPFGSDELNRIQKEFKVANDAFEKAWGAVSGAESQKCNELYDRKDSAKSRGWEFDLDAKDNWSATLEGVGVQGYNSLERLLSWIESKEPVRAEEEEAETVAAETAAPEAEEAAPAGQMTLDEIEEVQDFLTNGWAIRKKESGAYWAHKVINGKPVTIEERVLDDLIVRMEEFDPPKDVRPAETLPTSEIKKCRFELTDEDVKLKTNALLETMTVIDTKRAALADIKKEYKKALEKLESEQEELRRQIQSRVEYRPIECDIEYDLQRGEKIYYRPDTGEQIDRLSMSNDELRIALKNAERAKQPDLF